MPYQQSFNDGGSLGLKPDGNQCGLIVYDEVDE